VSDFSDEWFAERYREMAEFQEWLLEEFPEVVDAAAAPIGSAPPIGFLCPRGHAIITVRLGSDYNGNLYLAPVDGERFEAGRQVARGADVSANAVLVKGCAEPGCPKTTTAERCEEHAFKGSGHDETERIRTTFDCPKGARCNPRRKAGFTGTYLQTTQLKLYATALRLRIPEIRLPF
jgi:hypothetical protein